MHRLVLIASGCTLLLACDKPPSAARAPAPVSTPAALPTPAPLAAATAPTATTPPAANHPPTCEVELYGKVTLPPKITAKGHLAVHFSTGDCLKGGTILSSSAVTDGGTFGAEILPPWGSDITVCGVLEEVPGKP